MDLMKATTSFSKVREKYHNFNNFSLQVKVDQFDIINKENAEIVTLSVDLSCGNEASGCSFEVVNEYNFEQDCFSPTGVSRLLQIGASVEILAGYDGTNETLFFGLITKITYQASPGQSPSIIVDCMDAKCLLMKTRHLELRNEEKVSQVIEKMLSGQPISSYLKGSKIEATEKTEKIPNCENNFSFISQQAENLGYEFFIFQGEAYFRKRPTSSSPIMDLSSKEMVFDQRFTIDGNALVNKVTVIGKDHNQKEIKGSATISGKFSTGPTSKKMIAMLEDITNDGSVQDAQAATAKAKLQMEKIQQSFGNINLRCYGLPELVPGRFINVVGMLPQGKCSAYILSVQHSIDKSTGFISTIEAEVTSL